MTVVIGPVLGFRGLRNGKWHISALVVCKGANAPSATCAGEHVAARKLHAQGGSTTWRFDMEVPVTTSEQAVDYTVAGVGHRFHVPAKDAMPTMAYTSCNGFSSASEIKKVSDKNAMWKTMAARHKAEVGGSRYHLLLMGGDQVYGDQIWELPAIKAWLELPEKKRRASRFTQAMHKQVEKFYHNLYLTRWSQPEMAEMLASIPTIMMWDDHDIFDGWGSYEPEDQHCDVYQGIFLYARRYFKLFQQHLGFDEAPHAGMVPGQEHFSLAYAINGLAIVAPDMRSERTRDRVLSAQSWEALYHWIDKSDKPAHLIFMSSIPVVHPDFTSLEAVLCNLPGAGLEDDLRDHWHNRQHKGERLRLIHRLFALCEAHKTRVTIVSGDVHVAAIGALVSQRHHVDGEAAVINQLTSSGIVHPAPNGMVLYALTFLCRNTEEVDMGIIADMLNFPGTQNKFIGARNYLSLEPDGQRRIWANWLVEGENQPFTKVVHPYGVQGERRVRQL